MKEKVQQIINIYIPLWIFLLGSYTWCVYLLHAKVILLGSPTFYWCHKFLTAISTSNIN